MKMLAPGRNRRLQRGQAAILTTVLVVFGLFAGLYTLASTSIINITNRQADATAKTMAEVKAALIAWSAARAPTASNLNARPGELPCPDTDNNGYAENDDDGNGTDTANCAAGTIGRVPWKTLGIPEPKDAAGETLWYAISGNFRVYRSSSPNIYTSPITSDTLGTLTVYQDSTSNTITSQAIAVIFAPGAALGGQNRSSTTTMSCSVPSGTYFRNQCALNYLDSTGSINNASINGPFIRATPSPTFNDRLLVVTTADLMPVVEQRVAREMMSILETYRIATGVYPWADLADGNSNASSSPTPNYYNRNRFPCGDALPYDWGRTTTPITPSLPNWLTNGCASLTGWNGVIFYSVAKNKLEGGGANCTTCGATTTLSVTNGSSRVADLCTAGVSPFKCTPTVLSGGSADLLLITPGAATTSRSSDWPTSFSTITNYFEDAANGDNNDTNAYVVPTPTSYDRDRIFVVR